MATQRALIVQSRGVARVISDQLVPSLHPDHMLVKVKAVALNPTDWKHMDNFDITGCVSGVEYAGVIERLPEGNMLRQWNVGDRVAGTVHGCRLTEQIELL